MKASSPLTQIAPRLWQGLEPSFRLGRFCLTARCSEPDCDEERTWSSRTVFDPNAAVARAHQAGWKTGKVKCPAHAVAPKREKSLMPSATTTKLTPVPSSPLPETPPASISADARKALRLAIQFLEDYFDEGRRNYKPGWSDERISAECGASVQAVANERERLFGPLGEPDEIAALRQKLETLRTDQARLTDAVNAGHDRIKAAAAELDRVCCANGWKR